MRPLWPDQSSGHGLATRKFWSVYLAQDFCRGRGAPLLLFIIPSANPQLNFIANYRVVLGAAIVSKLNIVWLHKVLIGGFEAKPNFLIFLVASHNSPQVA